MKNAKATSRPASGDSPGTMQTNNSKSVLVTDGEQRAALAIVRSLGAAGYRCIVSSQSGHSLAGTSRFTSFDLAVPDAADSPESFVTAVLDIAASHDIEVIVPVSEPSLLALLPERDRFEAKIPFPDVAVFRSVCDKAAVLDAAATIGIRVPRQRMISTPGELALAAPDLPVVLKPHASVVSNGSGGRCKVGVYWARTRSDLERVIATCPESAYPLLAQEVITGPGIGVFVLMHDGESIASFSHRRIREKPPSGGVSVACQSEPLNTALLSQSIRLLQRFDWTGPAMVEYKRDMSTGEPVLMEINGRFWGSLQLAIDAGVDFPRLMLTRLLEESEIAGGTYRNVRTRWFWGDVDHMLARFRDPDSNFFSKAAAGLKWLAAFRPGYRSEIFRWNDPWPFFSESVDWFRALRRHAR